MNPSAKLTRRRLFFRLWWRSLAVKRPQAALALGSLLVGAAVVSMLFNLYGGVRRKMTREFRAYGANVVLAPGYSASTSQPHALLSSPAGEGNRAWGTAQSTAASGVMDQSVMSRVKEFAGPKRGVMAVPVLYGVVRLKRTPPDARFSESENVVAVGTDLSGVMRMNPGWRESKASDYSSLNPMATCAIGAGIASRLRVAPGEAIHLDVLASPGEENSGAGITCGIASVLSTGASEDDQVFLPLEDLQKMLGMTGEISLVQLRIDGDTGEIESSIRALSKALPGVDVRPIRQIVYSEGRVLGVIRWFLLSVTGLILVTIGMCLTATMTALLLERRKDIGVMKALGASDPQVMRLFLAEGAALGVAGGCSGFFVGGLGAYWLAQHLFGVNLTVIWWTLPLVTGLAAFLALAASAFPVRMVRAIQPAVVLKGE